MFGIFTETKTGHRPDTKESKAPPFFIRKKATSAPENTVDPVLSYRQYQQNTMAATSTPLQNSPETELEKDGAWRSMGATLALLKQAAKTIEDAEQQIMFQRKRIENLQKLSNTDELTGLHNRRGFIHTFERELDRVERDKSQGGLLIMIDLDNFKAINDTYGHKAGDTALRVVAKALEEDIRTMDIAARLGGDEFVLLFVNTTRKQALARAQQLIQALNNISFIWHGTEIPVRASLGLKEYRKGSQIENLFAQADANMYANKRQMKKQRVPSSGTLTPPRPVTTKGNHTDR